MGSKSRAPDYSQYLESTKELGQQYLGFAQEQFRTSQQRMEELMPYQRALMNNQADLMQGQREAQAIALDQAKDQYNYNRETFRPLEGQLIQQAKDWNTDAERERLASQAGANVQQAIDNQRGQSIRALERMGVTPSSGRMMQLLSGTGLQGAAMQAQAQNTATQQARDQGYARLAGAVGMGRGLSAQSIAALNAGSGAAQAGSGAASVGSSVMGSADRVGQMYTQNAMAGLQGYGSSITSGANITNMGFQNEMAANQANNALLSGVGGAVGSFFLADGGLVRGPGTGTSDSVPAVNQDDGSPIRLSNGEYVLPAETVRKIGINKLDRIVEKTNGKPPVHRRKALES